MLFLSVITELDGLAKGQDSFGGVGSGGRSAGSRGNYNVSAAHVRSVQEKARQAVAFLEKGFEAREPCLRALTSRGNQLDSIAFRSEDTSGQQVRTHSPVLFHFIELHHLFWSLGFRCTMCNEIRRVQFFFRETMMMLFSPVVSTTAKTKQRISCLIREVCDWLSLILSVFLFPNTHSNILHKLM